MTRPVEGSSTTERPPLLPLLGWLLFVVLVVYALTVGGAYGGISDVDRRIVSLGLIGVTLAGWAILALLRPEWRPGTAIWPALVAPLVAMVVSLLLAEFPRLGIEYVAWAFLLVAIYLLLVRILRTEFARRRIGGLALVLGLVVGAAYLGFVLLYWVEWWDLLGRFEMPPLRPKMSAMPLGLNVPNVVASVMVLLTVLAAAGLGLGSRGRQVSLVLLAGHRRRGGARHAAAVRRGSGWEAPSCSWVGCGCWRTEAGSSAGRLGRRGIALLGGGAGAVVVAALVLGPTLLDRLLNSGDGGRPSYWAAAWRMFEDAPLTGLGPGAWAARRLAYLESGEVDFSVPHAHNVYLQTAAELGVVGLAAGVIAGLAVGWLIYRALRSGDGLRTTWAWAVLFGATYLAVVERRRLLRQPSGRADALDHPAGHARRASHEGHRRATQPGRCGHRSGGERLAGDRVRRLHRASSGWPNRVP